MRVVQVGRDGPLPFAAAFDRVLVDAPCSGLGTVRRDPDIKWRRTEADLAGFGGGQRAAGARRRVRGARRPAGVRHLLERARGERRRRGRLPRGASRVRAVRRRRSAAAAAGLTDERGVLRTLPFATGWRPSSPPASCADALTRFVVRSHSHFMPFGTRVWTLGKLLLLIGALAATFLASFGLSMRVALRAREVAVPALAGVTVNDATAALGELGLTLRVDDSRRPDEHVPAGRIMQQDPAPGTRARRQRTVRVWLSAGPAHRRVPQLVGEPERTARIRLEQGEITIVATSASTPPTTPPTPSSRRARSRRPRRPRSGCS